jgi:CHASE3 domain sensor protein
MYWRVRKPLRVFARSASLRRRVAYSLAVVRLILVPVIFLAIYYLLSMVRIVDRIVNVDAPVATLAERASVKMKEARTLEHSYFLSHDPEDLQGSRRSLSDLRDLIGSIRDLRPQEQVTTGKMLQQVNLYQERLEAAVSQMGSSTQPVQRLEAVVRAYERDLNQLLRHARNKNHTRIIDELYNQVGSFDARIRAVEAQDPALRQIVLDLQASSDEVVRLSSDLETRSWDRVQRNHQEARRLVLRAEKVLIIVSALTLILSVLVSFVLPREVVKPLADLKAAVDHAAAGDYEIEFDVQGEGEVVQLADSVRGLITHVREKKANSKVTRAS